MAAEKRPSAGGRVTIARHGVLRTRHPLITLLSVFGVVLGVVGVSGVSLAAYNVWDASQAIATNAVVLDEEKPLPPSLGAIEGGVNILLVGTDSCEGQDPSLSGACRAGDTEGERNDVTMLVHISDEPRRVTVVSFPRDMLVPIPACEKPDGSGKVSAMSSQMINASYWYGGLGCTVDTVENLIGNDQITIDFAAAIRWTGVINVSNAIGGVDVCVAGDINDVNTGLHLTAGTHTLTGVEALQFLRIRHGIGDGSDLGRISNQQQFMSSLVRKLQSDSVLANPATLFNLATTTIGQVQAGQLVLSSGLTNPTLMVQIAMAVKDVPFEDIVFVQYPTVYAPGLNGSPSSRVLPVKDAAKVLFDALAANQPLSLTGDPSGGRAIEVTGEAQQPATTPTTGATQAPADGATDAAAPPATDAGGGTAATPEQRVELPSNITGQTAKDTTCTLPQK
ncbi:LCP family protein [Microbacterium kyungheense]|uniref:LytR family transcriptional attenuator n=1 Tax=Microbacterium kyungheense TaxID=1263636 RepID=A0A543EUF7_9MICO|nr:LCP family protein [Microbacterium kyungheense]TQM25201.1 LytR family transcriptional attenuator [Microbacterium kyungheense]